MAKLNFTKDQFNSFKLNGLTYLEKLENQSKEVLSIVETISKDWTGTEAQKCIRALTETSDNYKKVAKDIQPLNDAIKATVTALAEVYGDV
jgi:hypothetical protein